MVRVRRSDVDHVYIWVLDEFGIRAVGGTRRRGLLGCDDLGNELFSGGFRGRGRCGGDGVLDVVDIAGGGGDEEVFGEGPGYTAGG